MRPGRFDRMIEFPIPDEKAREAIFKVHTRPLHIHKDVNLKNLVKITDQTTGADIKAICTEAGMFAIRRDADVITNEDFIKAINKITKKDKIFSTEPKFFT